MREFTDKIKEKLKDGIQTILSDYRVEMALKIAAVVAGIACVVAVGYGIYKYHYYRGEIVWTDNYKLEDIGDQQAVIAVLYGGGQGLTRYAVLMDKKGRVKIIDAAIMDKRQQELGNWEGTYIELYDYYLQNEDIPYEEETIKVSDEVLTDAINIKEVELTEEFSKRVDYPSECWYVVHGSGENREEVLIAEFFTTRRENRRKELEPVLGYAAELAAKLPY